jgi:hypothetical protein
VKTLLLMVLVLMVSGCGRPAGSACLFEGSGFTASDPCATRCLSHWDIACPDGTVVHPKVCAGKKDCTPGSCPDGQVCYAFDDPFEDRRYCIPDNVCGVLPDAAARAHWEQAAAQKAAATRAKWEAKRQPRGAVTKPMAEPAKPTYSPNPP